MQLKILFMGDHCSVSTQSYLVKLAKSDDFSIIAGNITLEDNSLEAHASAISSDSPSYRFEFNEYGSVRTTVCENFTFSKAADWFDWDYIAIQQAQPLAEDKESYFPHINIIIDKIKSLSPRTEIIITEPWAYEQDCMSEDFGKYSRDTDEMTRKIREAMIDVTSQSGIKIVLPLGEAWDKERKKSICRLTSDDGLHASRCGDFLSSAVCYEILTGNNIAKNNYRLPFVNADIAAEIKNTAHEIAEKYRL